MENPTAEACTICTKMFSRASDLHRHMKTHNREKFELTCSFEGCNYKALQHGNLKTHLNTHTGERPHVCPEDGCAFSTSDPGSLTRHRKRIHGYEPKRKSGSRKQTRRQRRVAPYASPSTTSTSGSGGSASPLDPSLEVSGTPAPEIPSILDQTAPLSRVASNGVDGRNARDILAANSTELIPEHPQVNDSQVIVSSVQTQESLPPQPASMTEEAEPPAEGYLQSSPPEHTQQGTLPTFNLPAGSLLPEVDGATNASFNDSISLLDHPHGQGLTPSYITSTVYNPPAPIPASFPSYGVQPYSINDYLASPANLSAHGNSYAMESAPYGHYDYPTQAASYGLLDAQTSHPSSSSTPNTGAYPRALHLPTLDQTYNFYTTPMATSGWSMQESSYF